MWAQTFTGKAFSMERFEDNEYDLRDIAHSLAMMCRFNGHTKRFLSVAEHSVHVMELVRSKTDDERIHRAALLHDAAEAYTGDVTYPMKRAMRSEWLRDATRRIDAILQKQFDAADFHSDIVIWADLVMLHAEKTALMAPEPQPWDPMPNVPHGVAVHAWDPCRAKVEFLASCGLVGVRQ
jgi:hypothetical protein